MSTGANVDRRRFYTMLMTGIALAIVGGYLLIAQPWVQRSSEAPPTVPFESMLGYVSRATVASWPLTVDDGLLKCGRAKAVTLTTRDAKTYALNAPARGQGITPIDPLLTPGASLDALIDLGLERCP